jgi:hypothetical protein
MSKLQPSSLIWWRLKSSPLLAAAKPQVLRQWLAAKTGHANKVTTLTALEPAQTKALLRWLEATSNRDLEAQFHQWLETKTP